MNSYTGVPRPFASRPRAVLVPPQAARGVPAARSGYLRVRRAVPEQSHHENLVLPGKQLTRYWKHHSGVVVFLLIGFASPQHQLTQSSRRQQSSSHRIHGNTQPAARRARGAGCTPVLEAPRDTKLSSLIPAELPNIIK